ncbi:hypothetical protein KHS38_04465 [Mucilaginibacter sp. Bleaf8]|uniref:hypothetical protein n=1 Tax=Mucilaginibacter sp. Bleaf8 TaxID=2834430 RepID=UPI001BCBA8B4|nr:hypothetical protein [Mucilaginibacter sp. Bleaf8]MBS7563650.1 hypothetical protein [Mucilaginibacter sp. Bleaf8]
MKNNGAEPVSGTDMEIDEEVKFTQTSWRLQKVAWVAMFVLIAIVCTGLFGDGMLSDTTGNKQNVNIKYERYLRYQAEKMVLISAKENIHTITISQSLVDNFKITEFVPQPESSYVQDGHRVYVYKPEKNLRVLLYIIPMKAGHAEGDIIINNVAFHPKFFIYP